MPLKETPSPALSDTKRQEMAKAAETIGRLIRYEGAGTVEFLFVYS
jgi:acetyl-CoA carboxylase biotin carboxylase subunit